LFTDALIITALFSIFAISHTVFASYKFKKSIAEKLGNKIAFYRLFYNISATLLFVFVYFVSPKPDYVIYDLNFPFDILIVVLQIFAGIALLRITKFIDIWEFAGIKQVKRYLEGTYKSDDLDEKYELREDGPFKYTRHPIYLFSSLFLMLRPTMDFFYLIFLINMVLYFYIGSYFEEKKLITIFGNRYIEYQKKVPKIFPNLKLWLKK
jgi:protein-S-isoprenylcysteine O-methyltransferase Ste14